MEQSLLLNSLAGNDLFSFSKTKVRIYVYEEENKEYFSQRIFQKK